VNAQLRFLPRSSVRCGDVAFIQAVRSTYKGGRDEPRAMYPEQVARQTTLAWSIDQGRKAPSPYYVAAKDDAGKVIDHPEYGLVGRGRSSPYPVALYDRPNWDREHVYHFEACAVCRSGRNTGQVYGCATWGFIADEAGKVTLMPRGFRQMPSDQFEEARVAWNAWRRTIAEDVRPEEAPELESP
jgi:hypothetical protein